MGESHMINARNTSNSCKIGIFGLDNAGKTTIVKIIQGEQKLDILASLQPTIQVQIEQITTRNTQWVIWDFGGQQTYRENYLKSPNEYFDGLDLFIYVVDVQDGQRFTLSLKYLNDCLNQYKKFSPGKTGVIFLHKADPDLAKNQKMQNNIRLLHRHILQIARDQGVVIRIWSSTIFDSKLRLIAMMGGGVLKPLSNKKLLPQFIQEAKKTHTRLSTTTSFETQLQSVANLMEQKITGDQKLKQLSFERKRFIEEIKSLLKKRK